MFMNCFRLEFRERKGKERKVCIKRDTEIVWKRKAKQENVKVKFSTIILIA